MLPGRISPSSTLCNSLIAVLVIFGAASCSTIYVKNYPVKKPFVYKTNISLNNNLPKDSSDLIKSKLQNQLDDSLKARTVRKLMANWGINRPVLDKPPVYDPANAEKSITYMRALLVSLGYFKSTISYNTTIDTVKEDQYRTTINFDVNPGKAVTLDSISYRLKQDELQRLTMANLNSSLLKKGDPFAKTTISNEFDRLSYLFQNNGYMRFGRDMLQGVWDTLNPAIFNPSLDPFEQIALLDSLRKSRINPTANLEIRFRPGYDADRLRKYYIDSITIYPDFGQDTLYNEAFAGGVKVRYSSATFNPKIFPPGIFFQSGSLYSIDSISKTINHFNRIGAWRLVEVEKKWRAQQDTADIVIRLTPAQKFSFTANLEGSYNQNAISGNLAGFSINTAIQNRNVWKRAYQSVTNLRFGIETGKDTVTDIKFVQTKQLSFSHSIFFPKAILLEKFVPRKMRENARTVFTFNAATTERRELLNLVTVNISWGYDFQWNKNSLSVRFPNIEYSSLKPKPLLETLFVKNPALQYIFTDGLVSSAIASFTRTGGKNKNVKFFRANVEIAGVLSGLIKKNDFLDTNLYRFLKLDAEFTRKVVYNRSAIALRFFAGVGYEFSSTKNPNKKNNLPFFKEYFAGGPNSMRAWQLRRLGQGSSLKNFDQDPFRYGDVQLEANIEYRFPIANVSGSKLNGALFSDIGNIWFLKKAAGRPDEEVFNVKNSFFNDLAIGAGAGLRIDFSFFILRFDYSYKVKDPSPSPANILKQNKWFGYKLKDGDQFQLGISYPFIL
jgi:outer membrane protein assembly factor BamA